jgi:hypothetical protein
VKAGSCKDTAGPAQDKWKFFVSTLYFFCNNFLLRNGELRRVGSLLGGCQTVAYSIPKKGIPYSRRLGYLRYLRRHKEHSPKRQQATPERTELKKKRLQQQHRYIQNYHDLRISSISAPSPDFLPNAVHQCSGLTPFHSTFLKT